MEWAVGSLNDEASHGLCLGEIELHGFAFNCSFLNRLETKLHSPSGDNPLLAEDVRMLRVNAIRHQQSR